MNDPVGMVITMLSVLVACSTVVIAVHRENGRHVRFQRFAERFETATERLSQLTPGKDYE
jgi:hypothetical protein